MLKDYSSMLNSAEAHTNENLGMHVETDQGRGLYKVRLSLVPGDQPAYLV